MRYTRGGVDMRARLCSENGRKPYTTVDIDLRDSKSFRAYRELQLSRKRAYVSFRPQWVEVTVGEARELLRVLQELLQRESERK